MKILVVAPFLNEAERLPIFLESLAAQTRLPDRVVLVDDGSTDGSTAIAGAFAEQHAWARVLRRPPRPPERDRLASAQVWMSFRLAVESQEDTQAFDVVAKVDTDLRLRPDLLGEVEARFGADPSLGLTGPYLAELDAEGTPRRLKWRPEHVGGAVKFYRRQCYDQVYPLPPLLNLDMVDELKARSLGWRTASFAEAGGDSVHLRPHGSHDGVLRGFRRWGQGDYASGSHPLLVLLVGLQRLKAFPPVVGTLNYWAGWLAAGLQRAPRFPPELRELRREEQLARLRRRLRAVLDVPAGQRWAALRERARDEAEVHGSAHHHRRHADDGRSLHQPGRPASGQPGDRGGDRHRPQGGDVGAQPQRRPPAQKRHQHRQRHDHPGHQHRGHRLDPALGSGDEQHRHLDRQQDDG